MTKAQMHQRAVRRVQSVHRNQRSRQWQTLQGENAAAYISGVKAFTDQSQHNTIVAEPRFRMYNGDVIQNTLDRRRRSASHNRERKRFSSTIAGFHKNEIGTISPGRD